MTTDHWARYDDGTIAIVYYRRSNMYWLMRWCKWALICPWRGGGYKTRRFCR